MAENRDYKTENKQLLVANVKLQNEAHYWETQFKNLIKQQQKEAKKNGKH